MNEDCLKLTTYFGERDRIDGRFLAEQMLDVFARHEIATSILLRGAEGFGLRHHLRTDRMLTLSEDLPMVAIAVDGRARIDAALAEIAPLTRKGLITLERARMIRGDLTPLQLPDALHEATKLTVYLGRTERVYGIAAFAAVCDLLYRRGLAGASVLLGVDGTVHGARARARFFGRNSTVPMMVIAVGSGALIGPVLPELNGLLRDPLVTLERVRICKRDGELIERPHALPAADEDRMELWQKLMLFTSEQARVEGRPTSPEVVRELRRTGIAGATSVRGIWGFHGDHEPHGDRILQLRRHVPVVTTVVDRPDRIAEAFEVVDRLTPNRGLVTSEMVPALAALSDDERRGGFDLARHRF